MNGYGNVPFELWLARACRRWNATPTEILAQPAGLLDRMALVENVADAFDSYKRIEPGKGAQWQRSHPEYFKLVYELERWQQSD